MAPHSNRAQERARRLGGRFVRATAALSAATVTVSGLVAATPSATPAGGSPGVTPVTASSATPAASSGSFADPTPANRPLYRFWNTGGMTTPESIKEQVAQIRASGAGGYEANQLTQVVESAPGYDPATMGWGTTRWTDTWTNLFTAGKAAGLRVDGIYTPGWSAGTQTVNPDGPGSAKEVTFGQAWLNAGATFDGPLPTPTLPPGVHDQVLQGVVAYRCLKHCAAPPAKGSVPVLDPDSAVDLTDDVADGEVSWTAPTAPADARYVLVAAWMNGTGQTVALAATAKTTYLVDHFSKSGFRAVKDYWDDHAMTPQLRKAMKAGGGSMFFDSLELNREGEQVRSWTGDFLQQFHKRRGYSLVPYLAGVGVTDPVFDFTGDTGDRVREDYNQTLSDLFVDNHLRPLKSWARELGMTVRGQGYSSWGPSPIDPMDSATLLDIPEGEDLSFTSGFTEGPPKFINTRGSDVWRSMASAAAQSGHNVVSTECCAASGNAQVQRQLLLAHVNQQFSVGVNQMVWHGWADQSAGAAAKWPGFSPFGAYVADVYGPQNPTFDDDKAINTYVGRMQTVLRRGELRGDVAVYRDDRGHSVSGSTGDLYFTDQSLARAGYTYGFMNSTLMRAPSATVSGGRLNPAGLGYGAFVWDTTANPETNPTMDLADAKRLLSWAKSGLPVIVVGNLPTRVRGNHPDQDTKLAAVIRQLLATRSVQQVATEAGVLGALSKAGVKPSVSYSDSPVVSLHRQTTDTDYYYLFNSGADTVTTTAKFTGSGAPYQYDAWTGAVTRMPLYSRTGSGVRATVSLASGDATVIAITRGNEDTRAAQLRDVRPTYATDSTAPNVTSPSTWTLDVTSWQAGSGGPNDTDKVVLDRRTIIPAADGTLPDWQHIDGLAKVAGTSTYTTTITTGSGWAADSGAYLDLGKINGLATVTVNGRRLPPVNQLSPNKIDLRGYLKKGTNTVDVGVSTLLGNAAYDSNTSYGLVGPVKVTGYTEQLPSAPS